jgi:hypothetical protein
LSNIFLTREIGVGKAAPPKESEPNLFLEEPEPCQTDPMSDFLCISLLDFTNDDVRSRSCKRTVRLVYYNERFSISIFQVHVL